MRILLAQNMYYLPSHGGANKSNRLMLEDLARRGHDCHAVAPLTGRLAHVPLDALPDYLIARGATMLDSGPSGLRYQHSGVTVHAVSNAPALPGAIRAAIGELAPGWVLVPSDDPGSLVLSSARRATRNIVYVVHTLQQLPFGPRAFYPSQANSRMVAECAGMVAVSRAAQDYVRAWSGLESELIHPHVYANVPVRRPDPTFQRYVTMVNPCAYKGIVIFLALADALPDVPFLAVRSWGTTEDDLDALRRRPNITVCDPVDDMDTVFGRTRVVLMPSLWDETFGYTAVEAMLHGIPVLAADVGGLREAALGVQPPLPVRPITAYEKGGSAMPQPLVPAQDVTMWLERLTRLLSDDAIRAEAGRAARRAARAFVGSIDPSLLERYLLGLSVDDACGVPR